MAMFWKYDENAKLIGEDVYMLTGPTHHRMSDDEKFTVEQLHDVARSFIKEKTPAQA